MTREYALKVLEMFLYKQCDLGRTKFAYDANTVWDAVNMAEEALEGKSCEDCVSRQEAIDEVRFGQSYITKISSDGEIEHLFEAENEALEEAVSRIEILPSVVPKSRHGEWVIRDGMLFCTACNKRQFNFHAFDKVDWRPPYCPNCGAYMRGNADADS